MAAGRQSSGESLEIIAHWRGWPDKDGVLYRRPSLDHRGWGESINMEGEDDSPG